MTNEQFKVLIISLEIASKALTDVIVDMTIRQATLSKVLFSLAEEKGLSEGQIDGRLEDAYQAFRLSVKETKH